MSADRGGGPAGTEEHVTKVQEVLAKKWASVFYGQTPPDWPDRQHINDAILTAIDRLDQAREQYYKERLFVDCLEKLCDTMKVIPVTTFLEHSVTSGYLHHLQSSLAQMGIEELSLSDLECRRRQTFSGMCDKPSSTTFSRVSIRRNKRPAPGVSSLSLSMSGGDKPKETKSPTNEEKNHLTNISNKDNNDARRLSLANYFGKTRVSSEERRQSDLAAPSAPKSRGTSMRKSINKKAASFLGRNKVNHAEPSKSLQQIPINEDPRRRRSSDAGSVPRPDGLRRQWPQRADGRVRRPSLSPLPSAPQQQASDVLADVTVTTETGSLCNALVDPTPYCTSTQDPPSPSLATPLVSRFKNLPRLTTAIRASVRMTSSLSDLPVPRSASFHAPSKRRSSCPAGPQNMPGGTATFLPAQLPELVNTSPSITLVSSIDDVMLLPQSRVASPVSHSILSSGASSREMSRQSSLEEILSGVSAEIIVVPSMAPSKEDGDVPGEVVEDTVDVFDDSGAPKPGRDVVKSHSIDFTDRDCTVRSTGAIRTSSTGSSGEDGKHARVSMSASVTSPSTCSDEKAKIILERINTLTRRNRVLSTRRRNCSDAVKSIVTAESVGDGDFRRMALGGFVEGEKQYRNSLRTVLFNYYKPLKALTTSSQPICNDEEVNMMFCNMQELYTLHNSITLALGPLVDNDFASLQTLPSIFHTLMDKIELYRIYMKNFNSAIGTVGRLRVESPVFLSFLESASQIKVKGRRAEPLEEMLRAPMVRLESYQAVLSDLCSSELSDEDDCTDLSLDVKPLQQILLKLSDELIKMVAQPKAKPFERKLMKTGITVELHEGKRKLRHICLFNDVLVCATRARSKSKGTPQKPHDCKWFLPLDELSWHPPPDVVMEPITPVTSTSPQELSQIQHRINKLKSDIKHADQSKKKFGLKNDRERKKKNLLDLEFMLKMMLHNNVMRLFSKTGKVHTLLFVEQTETTDWLEVIDKCKGDLMQFATHSMISGIDIQQMLFSIKDTIQSNEEEVKAYAEDDDVELLDGLLVVLVDCAYGLKSKGKTDVFIQLEVDTYGRLERKAKTKQVPYSVKPDWDQGFEVELEAAHSMTVHVYESRMLSDNMIARGVIDLVSSGLLDQEIHTIDIPLHPQGQLSMKLQYLTPEMMIKRSEMMKANTTTAVFGVPLELVSLREGDLVPTLVRLCSQEVELRGLEETGVYRISGLASDVKMLREAFDTDVMQAAQLIKSVDIHAVTGVLKLFLREMPEPLFPRILYNRFVEGSNLSNADSRVSCMIALLYGMPDVNLLTTLYLIKHLKRVSEVCNVNKMTTSNLATVIGPNVLKPVDDGSDRIVLDIGNQVSVLGFFLDLSFEELEPDDRDESYHENVSASGSCGRIMPSPSSDSLCIQAIHNSLRDGATNTPSPGSHRKNFINMDILDIHNKS